MSEQPRGDREWEHWPHERKLDDGIRHRLRGLFHPTEHAGEAVEGFVAQHSRELELRAAQLAETISDLERREQRTSELRVAVEQMLRRGSAELDERHAELAELAARLVERESLATETETLLAKRRTELGAVELRRAALERRETAVVEREEAAARQVADIEEREQLLSEVEQRAAELVERSTAVAKREERLTASTIALERDQAELETRQAAVQEHERQIADLDEHRREVERVSAGVALRKAALDVEESTAARQRAELSNAIVTFSATLGLGAQPDTVAAGRPVDESAHLLFVPGERYRLVEIEGQAPTAGMILELEGIAYSVLRTVPSPLPADSRRCAFLELLCAGPPG